MNKVVSICCETSLMMQITERALIAEMIGLPPVVEEGVTGSNQALKKCHRGSKSSNLDSIY